MTTTNYDQNIGGRVCPQCGKPMLLHFAKNPFRPIVACADCGTFVADDGTVKTCVGEFTVKRLKPKLIGQWRLRYGLLLAGLEGLTVVLVADGDPRVQLFDSRDNRKVKQEFYSILMGCRFEVEDCEVTL